MATALQTIEGQYKTPCSRLRSEAPALAKLVDDTYRYSQRLITPAERETLAALVPHYEASLVPASEMTIKRSIAMLSTGWPAARLSEEEAEARHMLYHAGLNDIPADLLSEACRQAVRTCKFFPSVAELRERCPELQMRKWRLWRIQFLIEDHDRNWREPEVYEPLSAEDQAKVDGFLRRAGIKAGAS